MHKVTANGAHIPALGFGTWKLEAETAESMVEHALKTGYRHIDTAQAYENEEAVGRGIRNAGLNREDIFLTSKVWTSRFQAGDLQTSIKESLQRLGTDHVDLMLLHWPNPDVPLEETLGALNDAKQQGLARNIGISNFPTGLIDQAVQLSQGLIATNQVEYHPFLSQQPVLKTLAQHGISLTAYCPLAQGLVFQNETLTTIGQRHGKDGGQVALRWLLQQDDVIAVTRSSKPHHIESSFDIFDFQLSDEEMEQISALQNSNQRLVNPDFAPAWDDS